MSEGLDYSESNTLDATLPDQVESEPDVGTPRYMAAEQWAGGLADARSDQFGFCVTLWESVYAQRAFAGETLVTLSDAIRQGQLREAPRRAGVPTWLRRVIERGLSVDPEQRWPGMQELLAALASGHGRGRGRARFFAFVGIVGLAAGVYAALELHTAQQLETCAAEGRSLGEASWTPAARATLGEALTATGLAYAEEVRPRAVGARGAPASPRTRRAGARRLQTRPAPPRTRSRRSLARSPQHRGLRIEKTPRHPTDSPALSPASPPRCV